MKYGVIRSNFARITPYWLCYNFVRGANMARKRASFLDKLISEYPNDELLEKLLDYMIRYYRLKKIKYGTDYEGIFYNLFIEKRKTYFEIAIEFYVCEHTIKNYSREEYSDLAQKLIRADYIQGIKDRFDKFI